MARGTLVLWILAVASLLAEARPARADELYRWDFDQPVDFAAHQQPNPGAWNFVRSIDRLRVEDGKLRFRVVAGDPYFYIDHLGIDAGRWGYVVLVMKTDAGRFGQIYFAESEEASRKFPLIADGHFHTYTVPLKKVAGWSGEMPILRFDVVDSGPAEVEIDSIAIADTPATSYELSPPPPARLVLSLGASSELRLAVLNSSAEKLALTAELVPPAGAGIEITPKSPSKVGVVPAGEQNLAWSVRAKSAWSGEVRLRLATGTGDAREIPIRIDAVSASAPISDGQPLFVAEDGVESRNGIDVPGEIRSIIVDASAGAATMLTAILSRGEQQATLALQLPSAAQPGATSLPLPHFGSGWTLDRFALAPPGRALRRLAFTIDAADIRLHAAPDLQLPTFETAAGEMGFIARVGEPLAAAVRLHNFGASPVGVSPTFRILDGRTVLAESRAALGLDAGSFAIARAADLRPIETGRYTLRIKEPASGLDLRLPLAVVTRDHTWDAARHAETSIRTVDVAALSDDERRGDDAAIEGFETAGDADVDMLVSELSPAVLVSTASPALTLFGRLPELGLGLPTHMAYASTAGSKVVALTPSSPLPTDFAENWALFWFAGAAGWDRLVYSDYVQRYVQRPEPMSFDFPVLVVFQHRPQALALADDGIRATFGSSAGSTAVMPLFGAARLAPATTRGWNDELPADVLTAARLWSRALRAYPVAVRETFSIDRRRDAVTVQQAYRFHLTEDDWKTEPLRLAPISPTIALAADAGFPLKLPPGAIDTRFVSAFGPWKVVPDSDRADYEIDGVLRYVDEVPVLPDPAPTTPRLRKLQKDFAAQVAGPLLYNTDVGWFGGGAAALAQGFKAAAIAWAPPADADRIRAVTQDQMSFFVLDDGGDYVLRLADERRGVTTLVDTFNHVLRYAGDDAAGTGQILRGTWEYAYRSGDWDFLRRRWPRLREAMSFLAGEQTWIIASRPNSGGDTFHDVILGLAAYARMAAVLGEARDERYASYLFAKNLVAYFDYEKASLDFARDHAPWLVPLVDAPMTAWDNYTVFGPFFTPLSQSGPYGRYSGFYEHYFRIGEGKHGLPEVLARFHRDLLPRHDSWMFGEVMASQVPRLCQQDDAALDRYCYQGPLDELRAHIRTRILHQPFDSVVKLGAGQPTMQRLAIDLLSGERRRNIVPRSLASIPADVVQPGVGNDALGVGHGLVLAHGGDGDFTGAPMLSWFGLNAPGKRLAFHGGNLMSFGVFAPEIASGAYRVRTSRPNWTTRVFHFDRASLPPT